MINKTNECTVAAPTNTIAEQLRGAREALDRAEAAAENIGCILFGMEPRRNTSGEPGCLLEEAEMLREAAEYAAALLTEMRGRIA